MPEVLVQEAKKEGVGVERKKFSLSQILLAWETSKLSSEDAAQAIDRQAENGIEKEVRDLIKNGGMPYPNSLEFVISKSRFSDLLPD